MLKQIIPAPEGLTQVVDCGDTDVRWDVIALGLDDAGYLKALTFADIHDLNGYEWRDRL